MIRSHVVQFRVLSVFAVLLTTVAVVSCSEDIQGGAACPLLCAQQATPLKDTVIDAVTFDTSIAAFPSLGFESNLILARRGDTLDAGIVTRYDTLPTHYSAAGQDSTITHVDSAYIQARRFTDSTQALHDSATVVAYDVTDAMDDTTTASLVAEMTAANKVGSRDLAKGENPDTLRILIDTARVRARVVATGHRMRIALRMVSRGSAELRFPSHDAGEGFTLVIHPSRDTSVASLKVGPRSDTPAGLPTMAAALADFGFVALARPLTDANALRVGGYPWRRVLLRFKLPSNIVDSSAVIRATLFLTQRPSTAPGSGDSVYVRAVPILASSVVKDLHVYLEFAAVSAIFAPDSTVVVPKDSGKREIDIVRILRSWRGQDTIRTPRAIALLIGTEGARPNAVDFFSMEAAPGLRPQVRITYASKPSSGRP